MAAGTRNQQGQLKQQISDLILNDDSIVKLIADAVSSLIVKKLSNSEDTIKKVASSITKEPALVETIAGAVTDKIADDRNDKREELVWELDGLEQYSRRNCLLVHGVAEPQAGTRSSVAALESRTCYPKEFRCYSQEKEKNLNRQIFPLSPNKL